MSSPTSRSMALCRERGWYCYISEKWNHVTKTRHDAFRFGDLHVMDDGPVGSLYVQACAACDVSKRYKKILGPDCHDMARRWLELGNRIQVWGWGKHPEKRGSKRMVWRVRIVPITLEHLDRVRSDDVR